MTEHSLDIDKIIHNRVQQTFINVLDWRRIQHVDVVFHNYSVSQVRYQWGEGGIWGEESKGQ